ncbi:MAG: hypothetical protein ACREA2_06380, partial [Blastocatellia bacterium]
MAWTSLQNSLGGKALVLAGPILRKVTKSSVTVWLALQKPGEVTLKVLAPDNTVMMEATQRAVAIGANLHIVAVTAVAPIGTLLTEGVVYRYDLDFNFDGKTAPMSLSDATKQAPLTYPSLDKPSFALPPKNLNQLRLLHGSCRMPHAEGIDAMPLIDDLIATTANNAYARPHQLLLTGDQIYADDVADVLLLALSDAAHALMGWDEALPVPAALIDPATKLPIPAMREDELDKAGFTSVDLRSHLMSLGEYLCMYLFVWSDVLWPADLPNFSHILEKASLVDPDFNNIPLMRSVETQRERVVRFKEDLGRVRRALANVPTYMIFDDHDVTDDFNGTLDVCLEHYSKPLGIRVIQNGLTAYALCQHWGNVPDKFEKVDQAPTPPERALLEMLDPGLIAPSQAIPLNQKAARYEQVSKDMRALLGMPENKSEVEQQKAVVHKPGSLLYNYTIEADGHQIIVTDTRTWRSFPKGGREPGEMLPPAQLVNQILETPALETPELRDRALLVVLSTNAPAVPAIRSAARHTFIARAGALITGGDLSPDTFEAWEIPSEATDRLLRTLTSKLPKNTSGEHYGRVILLSGDVHHSFATRLSYRAKTRFEDVIDQPATAVIAQLVSSSFKKETDSTRGFQRDGYTYAPVLAHVLGLIPPHVPEGYVGWNIPPGTKLDVGKETIATSPPHEVKIDFKGPTLALWRERFPQNTFRLHRQPDYRYRFDYLNPLSQDSEDPSIPPLPTGAELTDRQKVAQFNKALTALFRLHNRNPGKEKVIGVNNFSEVTFNWE